MWLEKPLVDMLTCVLRIGVLIQSRSINTENDVRVDFVKGIDAKLLYATSPAQFDGHSLCIERIQNGCAIHCIFEVLSGSVSRESVISVSSRDTKGRYAQDANTAYSVLTSLGFLFVIVVFAMLTGFFGYTLGKDDGVRESYRVDKISTVDKKVVGVDEIPDKYSKDDMLKWKARMEERGWTEFEAFFDRGIFNDYEYGEFPVVLLEKKVAGRFVIFRYKVVNKMSKNIRIAMKCDKTQGESSYDEDSYVTGAVLPGGNRELTVKMLLQKGSSEPVRYVTDMNLFYGSNVCTFVRTDFAQ